LGLPSINIMPTTPVQFEKSADGGRQRREESVAYHAAAECAAAAAEKESAYVTKRANVPCCITRAGAAAETVRHGCYCWEDWDSRSLLGLGRGRSEERESGETMGSDVSGYDDNGGSRERSGEGGMGISKGGVSRTPILHSTRASSGVFPEGARNDSEEEEEFEKMIAGAGRGSGEKGEGSAEKGEGGREREGEWREGRRQWQRERKGEGERRELMELVVWAGFGAVISRVTRFFVRLYEEEVSRLLDRNRIEPNCQPLITGPNTTHATETRALDEMGNSHISIDDHLHPPKSLETEPRREPIDTRPRPNQTGTEEQRRIFSRREARQGFSRGEKHLFIRLGRYRTGWRPY
jgi:hypothetical protein